VGATPGYASVMRVNVLLDETIASGMPRASTLGANLAKP
jgi:hypothetical protein